MDPLIELDEEQKPDARFIPRIFTFDAYGWRAAPTSLARLPW